MNLGKTVLHLWTDANAKSNAETIAKIANQTLKGYNQIEVIKFYKNGDAYMIVGNSIAQKHYEQMVAEAKSHHESLKHK